MPSENGEEGRRQTADNTSVVVVFFDDEADIEPPGKKWRPGIHDREII